MKEEAKLVGLEEGRNFALHKPPLPIDYGQLWNMKCTYIQAAIYSI